MDGLNKEIGVRDVVSSVVGSFALYLVYFLFPLFLLALLWGKNARFLFAEGSLSYVIFVVVLFVVYAIDLFVLLPIISFLYIAFLLLFEFVNLCVSRFFMGQINSLFPIFDYIGSAKELFVSGLSMVNYIDFFIYIVFPFSFVLLYMVLVSSKAKRLVTKRDNWVGVVVLSLVLSISFSVLYCHYDVRDWLKSSVVVNTYYVYKQEKEIASELESRLGFSKTEGIFQFRKIIGPGEHWLSETYPLLRTAKHSANYGRLKGYNVILIVLESVTAESTSFRKFISYGTSVTPFIDSLSQDSLVIENFYANTDYTAGAEIAILCSVYDTCRYTLSYRSIMRNYPGTGLLCLPEILKSRGYITYFFNGYTERFDNKDIFMPKHGIEKMITMKDFNGVPVSAWGVSDKILYERVIEELSSIDGKPFMAMIVTTSNHIPFDLPDYCHVEYRGEGILGKYLSSVYCTDLALRWFFTQARSCKWYGKTVFIITSDNGLCFYPLENFRKAGFVRSLVVHHIPFLLFCPGCKGLKGKITGFYSQVDITPTILDLLGIDVPNPFMGSSIFNNKQNRDILMMSWPNSFFLLSNGCLYRLGSERVFGLLRSTEACSKMLIDSERKLRVIRNVTNYLILTNKIFPSKKVN